MKSISMALPVISVFFLSAIIKGKSVPIVAKRVRKEVFLFCTLDHEDEGFEERIRKSINPKIIHSSEAFYIKPSEGEEGIFVCEKGQDISEAFLINSDSFKPLHISLTHNTEDGDKVSLEWAYSTWQIFGTHQKLPESITLEKIFF
ncbi:MAG: hypothetical protein V1819_03740 [bacterium]